MQRFFTYLSQSRAELAKVTWPTRAQATRLTAVVVVFSLVFAVFIAGVDYGFREIVQRVILKVK